MSKTSVSYQQVIEACFALLAENRKITLRAILNIIGGSPNNVLPLWKQRQQDQDEITLAALDEELSPAIKQAILGECARKVAMIKTHFAKKLTDAEQQWHDMQALAAEAETTQQHLKTALAEAQNHLIEQSAHQKLIEQRLAETESQLKKMTERYQTTLVAFERAQAEKIMLEKQTTDWQNHYQHSQQELKTLQAGKHAVDIEIATLKARLTEKTPH